MQTPRLVSVLVAMAASAACIDPGQVSNPPGLAAPNSQTFHVSGQASTGPCDACPAQDEELSYRTPERLRIGVAAIELLRSPTDPAPHLLWGDAVARDVDLVAGATLAAVDTGSIPDGTYTHLRVLLDYIVFGVCATGHMTDSAVAGDLDIDYALADHQDPDLGARSQGDYVAVFTAFGDSMVQQGQRPVVYPPPYPEASVETEGGSYQVTFLLPDRSVTVDGSQPAAVDVHLTFFIDRALGWSDLDLPGYASGALDISADPERNEWPASMAIQGFDLDVELVD